MPDYKTICNILGDLWENYREEEAFEDFIEYNDLGLPLAYALREGMVTEVTDIGQVYITESFLLFITALGIEEEEVKDGMSLDILLDMAEKKQS